MIRPLCRMGHPVLREKAQEISNDEIKSSEFKALLQDLFDSMKEYGGIGIAAPQIGVSKQVAIIELATQNRYGEEISLPLTVFINPKIEVIDETQQGFWEGCLSLPGLRGFVRRPRGVKVTYTDTNGKEQVIEASGFLATVLQHELDHLTGTLYIDHIKDNRELSFQEEFDQFHAGTNPDILE